MIIIIVIIIIGVFFPSQDRSCTLRPPHLSAAGGDVTRPQQGRTRSGGARRRFIAIWLHVLPPGLQTAPEEKQRKKSPSPVQRNAPVSQLHVKQYRVPLKASDKKPIWSPSSNHQFLLQKQPLHFCLSECYSSAGGVREREEDWGGIRAKKLKKCDNSTLIFMAEGKLLRKELFWDSFEPRNAGSKWWATEERSIFVYFFFLSLFDLSLLHISAVSQADQS